MRRFGLDKAYVLDWVSRFLVGRRKRWLTFSTHKFIIFRISSLFAISCFDYRKNAHERHYLTV